MKKDCSNCDHLGRDCPKTLMLLSLDELIDWCHYVMTQHRLTHDHVAKLSNTPKGTIDRVMAKQSADCRYSTIHAIVCALFEYLGISATCLDDVVPETPADDLRRALADSEKDRQALQTRLAEAVENIAFMKDQIAKKDGRIDMLGRTVGAWRRVVIVLAALLGVTLLVIIGALVVDKLNPNIGFFWR